MIATASHAARCCSLPASLRRAGAELSAADRGADAEQFVRLDRADAAARARHRLREQDPLLGYDLTAEVRDRASPSPSPGTGGRATARRRLAQFTHLADARNKNRINLDGSGRRCAGSVRPAGGRRGKYIKDPAAHHPSARLELARRDLYLGFWNGPERLARHGARATARTAPARSTLPVSGVTPRAASSAAAPRGARHGAMRARRASSTSRSGRWPRRTGPLVNTMNGGPAELQATASAPGTTSTCYVAFEVATTTSRARSRRTTTTCGSRTASRSCSTRTATAKNYFEMQVAPTAGLRHALRHAARAHSPSVTWTGTRASASGVRSRARSTTTTERRATRSEIAIPWTAFAAGEPTHEPPDAGRHLARELLRDGRAREEASARRRLVAAARRRLPRPAASAASSSRKPPPLRPRPLHQSARRPPPPADLCRLPVAKVLATPG